jgi:putative FmdB family regulatory protein
MPIHEYTCARCGRTFESLLIRKSDEAEIRCPRCGDARLTRQISRPAATRGDGSGGAAPPRGCGPVG